MKKARSIQATQVNVSQGLCRFFDDLPVPSWIYDKGTFRFLAVNEAAISAYGYTRDEFLSMTIRDIRPSEDVVRLLQAASGRFFVAGTQRSVWRHKRKNGEVFSVCISSVITADGNVAVVANDITDAMIVQHQRDKFLHGWQQNNVDLDSTMSEIREVAWAIRTDTNELLYTNEATRNVYGYTPGEMIADKNIFFNSIHEDDRGIVEASFQQALTEGRSSAAFRINHRDGSIRHLVGSAFLKRNTNAAYNVLAGFTTDVTEQRLLEDRIVNEERKLRSIINNTDDLIWSMDTDLQITEYNDSFRRRIIKMTGKSFSDIRQNDFCLQAFSHWDHHFRRTLAGEKIKMVYETAFNGETIFEETILNPIRDKDERIIGISCFTRDVTERKRYIREIEAQNKRLQDIAWIQSHKVRSHVATLLGLQPLLDCARPGNPDNKIIMDGIISELLQLDQVIKEINEITSSLQRA